MAGEPNPRPGWLLDELGSAGRENLDPTHVARYDGKEDADAAAEVALLEELGLAAESTLVELGPGTGQLTVAVAPRCRRVVAVDVSEPMLVALRAKLAEREIANVEIVRAGFLTYDHAGPPADFAYSRYALHHLPDFWKAVALARLRRVLRPGGVLRLWDVVFDFEAGGSGGADRGLVRERWRGGRGRVVAGRARGARPRRALDLHLAARADDRARGLRDRRRRALGRRDLCQIPA